MKNYLFDLYPNSQEYFSLKNRLDPDSCSKKLYKDFENTFFNKNDKSLPNGNTLKVKEIVEREKNSSRFWELVIQIYNKGSWVATLGLGTDYSGASIYWANRAGVEDKDIISFLEISRTFGGHIVYPRWINNNGDFINGKTINNAKGGEYSYYDRFDLTLFAIKDWFRYHDKQRDQDITKTELYDIIDKWSIWFEQFNSFEEFVEFFSLESFVDKNYKVYDLTSYSNKDDSYKLLKNDNPSIPNTIEEYQNYISGSNKAIELRNQELRI